MLFFWKILNRTLNLQRFTASVVAESNWDWCVKSKQHVLVISSESKENNIQTQIIFSRAVRSESNLMTPDTKCNKSCIFVQMGCDVIKAESLKQGQRRVGGFISC